MKNRNPLAVFFLPIITIGIYGLVWLVKTKNEMNRMGASIPTAWLLIIPFVDLYWLWKYCQGVAKVTNNELNAPLSFVLMILLSYIGYAIIQSEFNKVGGAAPAAAGPIPSPTPASPTSDVAMPAASPASPETPSEDNSQTPVPPATPPVIQ